MPVVQESTSSTLMASDRAFVGVAALIFILTTAVTIVWCSSMAAMGGMNMPGDWTMSMMWMRMPGQTWFGAAAVFLGMWIVMMIAMMLPSLTPMLWRYRRALELAGERRSGCLTIALAIGYFFVWTVCGIAAFTVGVALAAITMEMPSLARTVPFAIGVVVVLAGTLQFTAWKARQLACCRRTRSFERRSVGDVGTAWRDGLRLGVHCSGCCVGFIAMLLVLGVMDLRVMILVTAAMTFERLVADGERSARAIGVVIVIAGFILIARAAGIGS